ncbi:hypothetical protein RFM99_11080 [Mesorhizobium sp. VK4C]|uniref:hypothetical protein n=1 Tax=Mesorhizobium captivum TaxID=3072319 RepID=UPI002A241541|nr:hypothetical protein [Mesorhizobium sp. VK4C]MDX8498966.1 hypothetical protein [Mesorhizobium sp. VK4C]
MRHQSKPFVIEIKPSRKPKSNERKNSIWGKLDLTPDQDSPVEREAPEPRPVGDED